MSKVALTQGQWSVIDKEIWLDETNGFVYFHGLRETPLEKHLYVVSIDQPCNIRRLTTSGYSHTAYLNQVNAKLSCLRLELRHDSESLARKLITRNLPFSFFLLSRNAHLW